MEDRPESAHTYRTRVNWGDCDPAKIVYTGKLPAIALDAINNWWESHLDGDGWFQMELDRNVGTPFVRLEMDFSYPVTPRHELICRVWPAQVGKSSVTFRVDGWQDDKLCFRTRTVSVFIIADSFSKQPIPADFRELLNRYVSTTPQATKSS